MLNVKKLGINFFFLILESENVCTKLLPNFALFVWLHLPYWIGEYIWSHQFHSSKTSLGERIKPQHQGPHHGSLISKVRVWILRVQVKSCMCDTAVCSQRCEPQLQTQGQQRRNAGLSSRVSWSSGHIPGHCMEGTGGWDSHPNLGILWP